MPLFGIRWVKFSLSGWFLLSIWGLSEPSVCPGALPRPDRQETQLLLSDNLPRWFQGAHATITFSFVKNAFEESEGDPPAFQGQVTPIIDHIGEEEFLFRIVSARPIDLRELNNDKITNNLNITFSNKGLILSDNAIVMGVSVNKTWRIQDQDSGFILKLENNILNIYRDLEKGIGNFPDNAGQLIRNAFRLWSSVADLHFQEVIEDNEQKGQIRIGTHSFGDDNDFLGHASPPPPTVDGEIPLDGDIHFNIGKKWKESGEQFQNTAIHEIGHAIGLGHVFTGSNDDRALMYFMVGDTYKPITDFDKAYIQRVYGTPIPRIINNNINNPRLITWEYPHDSSASNLDKIDPSNPKYSQSSAYSTILSSCPAPDCSEDPNHEDTDVVIKRANTNEHTLQAFDLETKDVQSNENSPISNLVGKEQSQLMVTNIPAGKHLIKMRALYDNMAELEINFSQNVERDFSKLITINNLSTNDATPEISGTISESGSTITFIIEDQTFPVVDNQDGTWTLEDNTLPILPTGIYDAKALAMDGTSTFTDSTKNELKIDMISPSIVAGQISGDNTSIEIEFNEDIFGDALGVSPIGIDHIQIDVDNGGNTAISIDSMSRPDGNILQGGESKIILNLMVEGMLSGSEVLNIELTKPIFDAAGNSRAINNSPATTVMINGHIEFDLTFTPDDSNLNSITLTAGRDFNATNSNNDIFDEINSDQILFYLENTQNFPGTEKLRQDFRPLEEITIWQIRFDPQSPNQSGQLTCKLHNINPDYTLLLQKLDNQSPKGAPIRLFSPVENQTPTDAAINHLSFELTEPTNFELVYGPIVKMELPILYTGWNLISSPLLSLQSIDEIFGDLISEIVWIWNGDQFVTVPKDQPLNPENGYWIYCDKEGATKPISGLSTDGLVILDINWSLIGTIKKQTEIPEDISIAWEWNSKSQHSQLPADSIFRGARGYWVFSKEDDALIQLYE